MHMTPSNGNIVVFRISYGNLRREVCQVTAPVLQFRHGERSVLVPIETGLILTTATVLRGAGAARTTGTHRTLAL